MWGDGVRVAARPGSLSPGTGPPPDLVGQTTDPQGRLSSSRWQAGIGTSGGTAHREKALINCVELTVGFHQ